MIRQWLSLSKRRALYDLFRVIRSDVLEEIKIDRLNQLVDRLKAISLQHNLATVGQTFPVLVEGDAKKSSSQWMGKTDGGITVVWEKDAAPLQPGTLVPITVTRVTATTLFGHPVAP